MTADPPPVRDGYDATLREPLRVAGVREAAGLPPRAARLRLHRLQAREPRPARASAACDRRHHRRFDEYLDHLVLNPDEFAAPLRHDPHQRHQLLPRPRGLGLPARPSCCPAWSCGAERQPIRSGAPAAPPGEEAYTLAMVLAEILGVDGVPRARQDLRHRRRRGGARPGAARRRTPRGTSSPCRRRCASATSTRSASASCSARSCAARVIFGRNDLVQDAPISHVDLLTCRNTLMYFNAETQAQILNRLHFALRPDGRAVPRQGRDAAQPLGVLPPARAQAALLHARCPPARGTAGPRSSAAGSRPASRTRRTAPAHGGPDVVGRRPARARPRTAGWPSPTTARCTCSA